MFSGQTANNKDIANLQNNILSSSKNSSRNGSLENINLINSENEVNQLIDYIINIFAILTVYI